MSQPAPLEAVRECMASGWSVDDIALELDVTPDAVCQAMRQLELVAEARGATAGRKIGGKTGKPRVVLPVEELARRYAAGGVTFAQLAKEVGVCAETVGKRVREYNKRRGKR